MAGHTKLTEEVVEKFCDAISSMMPLEIASDYAGVHRNTISSWKKRGEKDVVNGKTGTKYAKFYCAIKHAYAIKIKCLLDDIDRGARSWQAKAWILERCAPKFFSTQAPALQELKELKTMLSDISGKESEENLEVKI